MATIQDIDVTEIQNATPEDQKPKGSAKLGNIIFSIGRVIKEQLTQAVINLIGNLIQAETGIPVNGGVIDLSEYVPISYQPMEIDINEVANNRVSQNVKDLLDGKIPFNITKFILTNPKIQLLLIKTIRPKINYPITDAGVIQVSQNIQVNVLDIINGSFGTSVPVEVLNTVVPIVQESVTDLLREALCTPNVQKIIVQRNAIVNQLNGVGTKLDKITQSIAGLSDFYNLALATVKSLGIIKFATSVAAKVIPVVPGAVPAALSDLEDAKNKLTFTATGTSKLDPISSSISTASISISVVNGYILTIVNLLGLLDFIILKLCPNSTLDPISKGIEDSASLQRQAQNTLNQTSYQGFIIEIEEIPYTPTVTRRRAVGKNQQGIVLIQTELSFTTNPQTLINELKLIIDRDNLKAY